jgi:hypothetical protein
MRPACTLSRTFHPPKFDSAVKIGLPILLVDEATLGMGSPNIDNFLPNK